MGQGSGANPFDGELSPEQLARLSLLWFVGLSHELAGFYRIPPQQIGEWTLREILICQRYVQRDRWRENRLADLRAGGKREDDEPDWFGISYRLPIDPDLPMRERQKQWNERIQPAIDAAVFTRNVAKGAG